jgi:hypothetical protein
VTASTLAVVVAVAAATAACLWLLLRRGSMTHRAERDFPDHDPDHDPDDPDTDPEPPHAG